MTRPLSIRRAAVAALVLTAAHLAALSAAHAQATFYACYVPSTGAVYRIKTADTPQACTKTTHVEFSWVDGAGAIKIPYSTSLSTPSTLLSLNNSGSGGAGQFLTGSNTALFGRSMTSTGLHGATFSSNGAGAGVKAEAMLAGGTALEVKGGAIRVTGAAIDTPTAAFRTKVGCTEKVLDHPMLNGNRYVLVFASSQDAHSESTPVTVAVGYHTLKGRWVVTTSNAPIGDTCYDVTVSLLIIRN
jgi:hypothetical protein